MKKFEKTLLALSFGAAFWTGLIGTVATAHAKSPINYPAQMQGAWCETLASKDHNHNDGFVDFERCHNAEKPTIQIEGSELRETSDLGCHLTKPLILKPTSRIAVWGIASELCDEVPTKTGYEFIQSTGLGETLQQHYLDK